MRPPTARAASWFFRHAPLGMIGYCGIPRYGATPPGFSDCDGAEIVVVPRWRASADQWLGASGTSAGTRMTVTASLDPRARWPHDRVPCLHRTMSTIASPAWHRMRRSLHLPWFALPAHLDQAPLAGHN
jgi:hypothetical protein